MENVNLFIPTPIENLSLPDPELRNYYVDLEKRILWLDEEVNECTLEIIKYIIRWNQEDALKNISKNDRLPIKIFFFSPGGSLDVNYSIIDTIELSETPIYGYNVGMCASAAAFIFLSCHKRYMFPHAYFIFHQGSGTISGTFNQIVAQVNDYQDSVEGLANFMKKHTNYLESEILEKITGEWYVRAQEAIDNNIVDAVINSLNEV